MAVAPPEGSTEGGGAVAASVAPWCIAPQEPLACPGPHEPAWPLIDVAGAGAGVAAAAGAGGWDEEHAGRAAASASFRAQIEGRWGCAMPPRAAFRVPSPD